MNSELTNSELISLLGVYEEEWRFRDAAWFSRMFQFFLVSFITILIPYLDQYFSIQLPNISKVLFPVSGIVIATVALAFSLMYATRLNKLSSSILRINNCFDEKYRIERIGDKGIEKLYKKRITYGLTISIYVFELILAVFVIVIVILDL